LSTPLVISFEHSYKFETDTGTNYDGAVIEYSIDDGVTWDDVTTLGVDPTYSGTVTADIGNELGGRMGYVGSNPAYPGNDPVRLDFGTQLAGKQFRIRFRIGTDAGTGAPGWTIDEVAFNGIVGTPFPTEVADDGVCGPPDGDDPIKSGGGGCCDAGPLRGSSLVLTFAVFGFVLRRRRRA